jgi:hypothetical protein
MYLSNKYSNWYHCIIANARNRILPTNTYIEKHHIIPKSLGGSNNPGNLVNLTAREHFICHILLTKFLIGEHKAKMVHATNQLMVQKNQHQSGRYIPSSKLYEMIRIELSIIKSTNMTLNNPMSNSLVKYKHQLAMDKRGKSPGMTGKSHSAETKLKMQSRRATQIITEKTKTKIRSTVSKLYELGVVYAKKECPHCKRAFDPGNFKKWHGDNCKLNIFEQPNIER